MEKQEQEKQAPAADALVKALEGVTANLGQVNARLDAIEKAPKVEQTLEQALKAQEDRLRDEYEKASAEKRATLEKELAEKEAQFKADRAEMEALRTSVELRRSGYSIGEMKERIEQAAGTVKSETKDFWNRLKVKAANAEGWVREFPNQMPAEVIMRGGLEPVERSFLIDGISHVVRSVGPMKLCNDPAVREAHDANDVLFAWMLRKQALKEQIFSIADSPFYPRYKAAMEVLGKAFTSTTIANWVPTGFSARIWERFELARNLTQYLEFYQMTQNPENMPVRGGYLTPVKVSATTSNPEAVSSGIGTTNPDTLKCQLELWDLAFRAVFNIGAEEDSIPSIVPALLDDLARSKAYWLEEFILNADSSTFHIDTDITPTGTDIRARTADGLRPTALRQTTPLSLASSGAMTGEALTTLVGGMGKYSGRASELVHVVGPKQRLKLKLLKNSSGHPLVVGSASSNSPVSTLESKQEIEVFMGSPLVCSEAMRETLGTGGFVDGTTAASWTHLVFNRRAFVLAARNLQGRFMTDFAIHTAQHQVLQYERWEFEDAIPQDSLAVGEETVVIGVGINVNS